MTQQPSAWRNAALILIALLLVANWPVLLGQMAPQWDAADFFGPAFSLVSDHIHHGRLMMWNPWVAGGSPDFAEPELGGTSPLLLAVALTFSNPQAGFVAYWMILWCIGGVGMLYLARHLGAPLWGAFICALGFTASGFYVGHAEHTSSLCSVAYLPAVVLLFDRAIERGRYWCAVQAGILYGLSALGGYPQFTILTPGFLALWTLGRGKFRRGALSLALLIGVGFVVCSPSHVTMLTETRGYSERVGPRSRDEAISSNLLPAGALITSTSPYLALLNLGPHPAWPNSDVSMVCIYSGAITLLLAIAGWRKFDNWKFWLLLMLSFFLACSLGSQLPLRGWLYDLLPPTRYFRNPGLIRVYFILPLVALAALATREWATIRKALLPAAAVLTVLAAICFTTALRIKTPTPLSLGAFHGAVIWLGLLALALAAWRSDSPLIPKLLVALAAFDFVMTIAISAPTLYSRDAVPWWRAANAEHSLSLDLSPRGFTRTMLPPPEVGAYPQDRNVILKAPAFDSLITFANRFHRRFLADNLLSRIALGPDRTWFSPIPVFSSLSDKTFSGFAKALDAGSMPMVLHKPEDMLQLSNKVESGVAAISAPSMTALAVSNLSYRPNALSFHCEAPSAGWVMITDRWAPGWEATVNGKPAAIFGGDFIFRALQVAAGPNNIEMRYRPAHFRPLLALSWGTLLLFLAIELGRKVYERRRSIASA